MTDEEFMAIALEEAKIAFQEDEIPIGAVLVKDGRIIARGHNRTITLKDPTAHAEIQALRSGALILNNYRLPETSLYVTVEPCIMCYGALIHARIGRLIYGAEEYRTGAINSVFNFSNNNLINHRFQVTSGILKEECAAIMQEFFRKRREEQKRQKTNE
ncbi:MAG: tRNA adenosine(34) deaminase TadA [Succinivibrionaceae bacterium]